MTIFLHRSLPLLQCQYLHLNLQLLLMIPQLLCYHQCVINLNVQLPLPHQLAALVYHSKTILLVKLTAQYRCNFLYAPEYTDSTSTKEVDYIPTPKYMLKLKTMADCQKSRIILNIGGSRFETCAETLMKDPSSILSYKVLPESPFKPYNVDNIYAYFIDRDPRQFIHVLNYLRRNCDSDISTLPTSIPALRELQQECSFYNLTNLHNLVETRISDILSR